jgi:hypothetical protein
VHYRDLADENDGRQGDYQDEGVAKEIDHWDRAVWCALETPNCGEGDGAKLRRLWIFFAFVRVL